MYHLEIYKQPGKFLEKLARNNIKLMERIILALEALKSTPLPPSSKQLIGYKDLYRLRIEKYRIVYQLEKQIIHILLIEKRDKVYSEIKRLYN